MTPPIQSFAQLSDDDLLATVKRLVFAESRATAALVRSLMELDARRLYLGEGYSSLFTFCTQALHLAEGAAYNRIETARAARRFPILLTLLEEGAITLTTARLLAPHLTTQNHRDVLASARHKRKREIEVLVASLRPLPPVPSTIRKLPDLKPDLLRTDGATTPTATAASMSVGPPPQIRTTPPASVTPLAPERYKLQLTISGDTHDKLRRVQALARHAIPSGNPAEIFDRALTLMLQDLERRRCAAATTPRAAGEASSGSRHIPASVKREVWRRDDGRCAFTGRDGRCTERGFLEYHHVQPYAAGGPTNAGNVELRCRAHNAYEASLFFGIEQAQGGETNDRMSTG